VDDFTCMFDRVTERPLGRTECLQDYSTDDWEFILARLRDYAARAAQCRVRIVNLKVYIRPHITTVAALVEESRP
jgi:hypothetical protein